MEEFVTYRHLNSQESAEEIVELFNKNSIETRLEKSRPSRITAKNFLENFVLKIRPSDFEKANALLLARIKEAFEHAGEDYYLYEFTDDELTDILLKRDEWAEFDFLMAQHLLKQRGKEITEEQLQQLYNQRIAELSTPKKAKPLLIIAGYLFVLLGGFIAIGIGYRLFAGKRILPNGDHVHEYTKVDREHGYVIFFGGFIVALIGLYLRFGR